MNVSRPRRRIGLAGATAALLTGAALGTGAVAPASPALADEAPTYTDVADLAPAEEQPAAEGDVPAEGEAQTAGTDDAAPDAGQAGDPGEAAAEGDGGDAQPDAGQAAPAGTVAVGVAGTYATGDAQALLDTVNALRAEAAAEGIAGTDGTPAQGASLSWSSGLAYVAQVRAAECAYSPVRAAEQVRPDLSGPVTSTDPSNSLAGYGVLSEGVANVGAADFLAQMEQEKQALLAYLAGEGDGTGFATYQRLISNDVAYVGMATFADAATGTVWTALELSAAVSESDAVLPDGDAVQQVSVAPADNLACSIAVPDGTGWAAGTDVQLAASVSNAQTGAGYAAGMALAWSTGDPNVATVDADGLLHCVAPGETTVTVFQNGVALASLALTVQPAAATGVVAQPAGVETPAGVAPALPATVQVAWSDGSVSDEPVAWDAVDPASYSAAGMSFTATGWAGSTGLAVTCAVSVAFPVMVGVDAPAAVETPSGTAPALPSTVHVRWSDGSESDEAVSWDAVDPASYSAREGGAFAVGGYVAGWADPVSVEVDVCPATMVSAADPGTVYTEVGVYPELPATVQVTWSNGDVTDEAANWYSIDSSHYAQPNEFVVFGEAGPCGMFELACPVTVVEPAPTVASVDAPAAVETPSGTAPALPATVHAHWSDGGESDEPVTWDAVDPASYSAREGGSFTVSGRVEGWADPVAVTVTVRPASAVGVWQVPGATVEVGAAPELPATVQVAWSNGDVTDEPVTWDAVDPASYAQAGSFDVSGTVGADGSLGTAVCTVTVAPPTVASVAQPAGVTTESGAAPELPATVQVAWSNGDVTDEPVTWDAMDPASYSARAGGTFAANGHIAGWDGTVSVEVTVNPAYAVGLAAAEALTTQVGVAPELPATMQVAWSNGDVTDEPVAWDEVDPSAYAQAGSFEITGTVANWGEAVALVNVDAAAIASVAQPSGVATPSGTAPELPSTVQATWTNGNVTDEPVAWDAVDPASYSDRAGGSFSVSGTVAGWDDAVSVAVTVSPAYIARVAQPASVSTEAGTAPELPTTVETTWSNGDVTDEAVAWDDVDPGAYAQGGVFTVEGTVGSGGPTASVSCTVTVVPTVTAVGTEEPAVRTASGTAPELPATVQVAWSDGSTTDEAVAWDDVDPASYSDRAGGSFDVGGTVAAGDATLSATAHVVVSAATVSSVADPAGVATPSGTAPALPSTVQATWTNGDVTDEPVAWDAVDPASYSARAGGSFDVAGAVEGWDGAVHVAVTVEPATVAGVEEPAAVETEALVAPELPATVRVAWSNGDATDEAVAWDAVDPSAYAQPGSFEVGGTVGATGETATVAVEVVAPSVVSVADPAGVATPSGTAPALPATVRVSWSNGTETDEPVTWDAVDPASYASRTGGAFAVAGTVAGWDGTVSVEVAVEPAAIASAADPAGVATPSGTAPVLPSTVQATWTNGDVTDEPVDWEAVDPASYSDRAGGTFAVAGIVAGWDGTVHIEVSVEPATIEQADVASVATDAGIAPELPATARVVWSNGDETDEAVTWDDVPADAYAQPGGFEAGGTVDANGATAPVRCMVSVGAAVVSSVAEPPAVETYAGAAPELPATVEVVWSDGSTTTEEVAWGEVDPASYAQVGTFEVAGSVGTTGTTARVTVNVRAMRVTGVSAVEVSTPAGVAPELPATVEATWEDGSTTTEEVVWGEVDPASYATSGSSFEVAGAFAGGAEGTAPVAQVSVGAPVAVGVTEVAGVSTPAGVAPELPATVQVALSDGSTADEAVAWETPDPAGYAAPGSLSVSGTTASGLPATVEVTVGKPVARNAQGVSVLTYAGTAPNLPATVQVTWSDGSVTAEDVAWANYDPALYRKTGSFQVSGRAAGLDVVASVTVQAADRDPAAAESEIAQSGDDTVAPGVLLGVGIVGAAAVVAAIAAIVVRLRRRGR